MDESLDIRPQDDPSRRASPTSSAKRDLSYSPSEDRGEERSSYFCSTVVSPLKGLAYPPTDIHRRSEVVSYFDPVSSSEAHYRQAAVHGFAIGNLDLKLLTMRLHDQDEQSHSRSDTLCVPSNEGIGDSSDLLAKTLLHSKVYASRTFCTTVSGAEAFQCSFFASDSASCNTFSERSLSTEELIQSEVDHLDLVPEEETREHHRQESFDSHGRNYPSTPDDEMEETPTTSPPPPKSRAVSRKTDLFSQMEWPMTEATENSEPDIQEELSDFFQSGNQDMILHCVSGVKLPVKVSSAVSSMSNLASTLSARCSILSFRTPVDASISSVLSFSSFLTFPKSLKSALLAYSRQANSPVLLCDSPVAKDKKGNRSGKAEGRHEGKYKISVEMPIVPILTTKKKKLTIPFSTHSESETSTERRESVPSENHISSLTSYSGHDVQS